MHKRCYPSFLNLRAMSNHHPLEARIQQSSLKLELNCLVFGNEAQRFFQANIASSESVHTLKKAIKVNTRQAIRNARAATLDLYNISVPSSRHLAEQVRRIETGVLCP
ncbi:hypothetical protein BC827DRAFT_916265 [Russula dissimulans]|nr:hypothetical protein BC827DRAFT_916265 [Russula dissimulans]